MLNFIKIACLTSIALILFSSKFVVAKGIIDYPKVGLNVPYSQVAELASTEPTLKVSYGSKSDQQYSLFWRARGVAKGVVVLVHGGCWLDMFDILHSKPLSTALSQAGFHVWSIEYRRTGSGGEWPIAFEDVKAGLKSISELEQFGVDLSAVNIVGHSAGGHLAMLAASDANNILPTNTKINLVGLAAISDVNAYAKGSNSCQTATSSFMNGTPSTKPIAYYLANPINIRFVESNRYSAILLHGTLDTIVPISQGQHPQMQQVLLEGAGHFDWIHPGSQAFDLLLKSLKTI